MKLIIWGHKYNGHTHSYIHSSYYKAAKFMGFDAYWLDERDDTSNFNFDNSIFITEDQTQHNIPLNKTCKYILHHTKLDKYIENDLTYINLANYLKYCDDGISAYHKENTVEKINDWSYWDNKTKTVYQPWGTDLIPNQINEEENNFFNESEKNVIYVGTQHDNINEIYKFKSECEKNNKNFINMNGLSDEDNKEIIRKTFISADLRGDWHKECGYLPCRVFKNISYGRLTGTNSQNVKKFFGDYVIFNENPSELYYDLVSKEKEINTKLIRESMLFIKENHTFVNRLENLIKLF
jgi:hypothetical protein